MPQIYVNDIPQDLVPNPSTWGELLDLLDAIAEDEGTILSAARFDGVEEPAFREPAIVKRALSSVQRVDVQTALPNAFLRECLLEAIPSLRDCADAVTGVAEAYRRGELATGHEGMGQLSSDLGALTTLVTMIDGPIGVDLAQITGEPVSAAEQMEALWTTLDAMVAAQAAEDWLTVADVLEYDLEPAIRRWADLLTRVADALQ
jgi:hypothetical protein